MREATKLCGAAARTVVGPGQPGVILFCSIAAVTPRLIPVSGRVQSADHVRKPAGSFAGSGPAVWPFKGARLVSSE